MQLVVSAQTELYSRRVAFLDLVDRARLAPPAQRAHLLNDAATVATLHHALTGTALLPQIEQYLVVEDETV